METKMVNFKIPVEMHKDIKIQAAKRNISMTLWMHRAFQERLQKQKKYEKE